MSLTLVIMAAGSGTRYGGNKPLASVGPKGQSLFEYSVSDAYKVGFRHIIFVVHAQQDTSVFSDRLSAYGDKLTLEFVVQSLDTATQKYPVGHINRHKPWGTGHAVLCCEGYIHNPFAVINADDYYGQEHYEKIGQFLLTHSLESAVCAMPGYRLANTLSESGGVNRGICHVSADGLLASIHEVRNISLDSASELHYDQNDEYSAIKADSLVSMTFWGFLPSIFNLLHTEFLHFLAATQCLEQDEFYLPEAINKGIVSGQLQVHVFETNEKWKGLTFKQDLPGVVTYVAELTDKGKYSDSLVSVTQEPTND